MIDRIDCLAKRTLINATAAGQRHVGECLEAADGVGWPAASCGDDDDPDSESPDGVEGADDR